LVLKTFIYLFYLLFYYTEREEGRRVKIRPFFAKRRKSQGGQLG